MAKDIVDVAAGEIGYREQGENRTKYGAWYGTNGAPWCHIFVSWCAAKAGVSASIVPKTASTDAGMAWFVKKGIFKYKGKYTPKRGDIIYFKSAGASHVGIVEKCSGNTVYTIEGNSSDKVMQRKYSLDAPRITGYGVPKYKLLNSTTSSSTGKKALKDADTELSYLKKILEKKKPTTYKIKKSDVVTTGKLSDGKVVVMAGNGGKVFSVPVEDGMKIVWERKGTPGKLTYNSMYEKKFKLTEGNNITVSVDNINIFSGFIFSRQISKDGMMSYTVYDQLRYLKNKDSLSYKNKSANEVIKMIAEKFRFSCGHLADTSYKMSKIEEDATLFDIIQNALDETLLAKGKVYVLYDKAGKIRLSDISDMKVDTCLVDEETGEDFTYKTTVDNNVYNQIKLSYPNKEKNTNEIYLAKHSENINKWGILQYTQNIDTPVIGQLKADVLLKLYNHKQRTLTVSGIIGNKNVRAGCLVPVLLDIKDMRVANYMMVEKVTHTFENHRHSMDLILSGGGFVNG